MSCQTAPLVSDRKTWPYGRYSPVDSLTPLFDMPVEATVTTTVDPRAGCDWIDVIARAGMSGPARFSHHVAPPSALRKMPPLVVPTYITCGFSSEISMAEIGDPSNTCEGVLQRWRLVSQDQSRADPAHSRLGPRRVAGSIASTVNAHWERSPSGIASGPGLMNVQPARSFHGCPRTCRRMSKLLDEANASSASAGSNAVHAPSPPIADTKWPSAMPSTPASTVPLSCVPPPKIFPLDGATSRS